MPVPRSLRQAGRQCGGLTGAGFDIGWRHAQNKEDTQEKAPCRQRLEKAAAVGRAGDACSGGGCGGGILSVRQVLFEERWFFSHAGTVRR